MTMRNLLLASLLLLAATASDAQTPGPRPAADEKPVIVDGVVPDEATKALILSKVRAVYGEQRVVDRIRIDAVVAPPDWARYVGDLVTPALKDVSAGELDVSGNSVRIRGQVAGEAQKQQVANHLLTALNSTYTVDTKGLRIAAAPQRLLDDVLANRIIEFQSGSATLTPTGASILDELVEPMRQIGNARVEIIGHTDNVGSRQSNLTLSFARAQAVRMYFSSKGVPDTGLSVRGMGPDQPVADNSTEDGRARNRRIQFKVL
jgi:OmpA-OmpF porin, OOP family